MRSDKISRRAFIKGTTSAIAIVSFPNIAFTQTSIRIRQEWQQFKTTPQYASFLYAIQTMRANTNATSRSSWQYWTNVHVNYCPHGAPYFLAWHRGYLFHFEEQLRIVSGDSSLTLPYWDYYSYATMPAEFTDPATGNPLYVQRSGTNVYRALSLAPFGSTVLNFQRGTPSPAFEPMIESAPHNPVHNLIGGVMATMQSPQDPIFFLHHANMDRLMHAWALPDGKRIPYTTNPYSSTTSSSYWAGNFTYASDLTLPRYRAYHVRWLNYDHANNNKPTSFPPQARSNQAKLVQVQAQIGRPLNRPPVGAFPAAPGRAISAARRSLGGASDVSLDENSVSARISLPPQSAKALQDTISAAVDTSGVPSGTPRSAKIVMSNIVVTGSGKNGGYFYNVYLNLPQSASDDSETQRHFLGTIGPFEISGAAHHGPATLEYPATDVLINLEKANLSEITVSLVRVNGDNSPRGRVIRIGEVRLEISTEAPWSRDETTPKPPNACYC